MKIFVMSDIHLGDSDSIFGKKDTLAENMQKVFACPPDQYPKCDVLILNGDILDFAINSFEQTYIDAQPFFQFIYDHDIAKMILYIPGNHDRQVWDALQWEVNVMDPIRNKRNPRPMNYINPVFIDFREQNAVQFPLMQKKKIDLANDLSDPGLASIFLQGLVTKKSETDPFKIMVAAPMVFVNLNPDPKAQLKPEDLLMIAHGQHLETGWVLITEMLKGYTLSAYNKYRLNSVYFGNYTMEQLEQYNYIFTSLIGTDSGQAGDVSRLVYMIERMVRSTNDQNRKIFREEMKKLLKIVNGNILRLFAGGKPKWLVNLYVKCVESQLMPKTGKAELNNFAKLIADPKKPTRGFYDTYMKASCDVMHTHGGPGPLPTVPGNIIFGHTHLPVPDGAHSTADYAGVPVRLYNTGAWLKGTSGVIFEVSENSIKPAYEWK